MSDWLDPVRAALDAAPAPVPFFFRDDDAGWDDAALWRLLDRCRTHGVHVDLAVIPTEVGSELAGALRDRAAVGTVHLHQHGFRHVNHEPVGRKCEFGPSRSHDRQLADIAEGRALLGEHLHPFLDPVFTPPWNRCTAETAAVLADLGFRVLSRDRTAVPFGVDGLVEVPVAVDWFATRQGELLTRRQVGQQIAAQIGDRLDSRDPVGIMLHHAVTGAGDLQLIDGLFALVAGHPAATSTSIYSTSSCVLG